MTSFLFAIIASFVGTALYAVVVAAYKPLEAKTPRAAQALARLATRLLPVRHRARYLEEWSAELRDVPRGRRLLYALGLLIHAPLTTWQLWQQAAPRRGRHQFVVPMDGIADVDGWLAGVILVEHDDDRRFRYRLEYARQQDDGIRIVVLTSYSKRDSAEEIAALVRQANALGQIRRTRLRRKARQAGKTVW